MVVSQFCFEPLQYFAGCLKERFPSLRSSSEDRRLGRLRMRLFRHMLVGHLEEIRRLLTSGGHAYLSFELFHRKRGKRTWFLPNHVALVFEEVARRFEICDDVFPLPESLAVLPVRSGESVVQSLLLRSA